MLDLLLIYLELSGWGEINVARGGQLVAGIYSANAERTCLHKIVPRKPTAVIRKQRRCNRQELAEHLSVRLLNLNTATTSMWGFLSMVDPKTQPYFLVYNGETYGWSLAASPNMAFVEFNSSSQLVPPVADLVLVESDPWNKIAESRLISDKTLNHRWNTAKVNVHSLKDNNILPRLAFSSHQKWISFIIIFTYL